jgi:hypothetical protein
MTAFGALLRQYRARYGSSDALGHAVPCCASEIRSVELGRRAPSRLLVDRLVSVFGARLTAAEVEALYCAAGFLPPGLVAERDALKARVAELERWV